jgi:hypothetical protein
MDDWKFKIRVCLVLQIAKKKTSQGYQDASLNIFSFINICQSLKKIKAKTINYKFKDI